MCIIFIGEFYWKFFANQFKYFYKCIEGTLSLQDCTANPFSPTIFANVKHLI